MNQNSSISEVDSPACWCLVSHWHIGLTELMSVCVGVFSVWAMVLTDTPGTIASLPTCSGRKGWNDLTLVQTSVHRARALIALGGLLLLCSTSVLGRWSLIQRWKVTNLRPDFSPCQNNTTICLKRLLWRRKEADFRSSLTSITAPKAFLAETLCFLCLISAQSITLLLKETCFASDFYIFWKYSFESMCNVYAIYSADSSEGQIHSHFVFPQHNYCTLHFPSTLELAAE